MSNNDSQTAQIQATLLKIVGTQGEVTNELKNFRKEVQDSREHIIKEHEELKNRINNLNQDMDTILLKMKYWKFVLYVILGVGGVALSLVEFSNEMINLMKSFFKVK